MLRIDRAPQAIEVDAVAKSGGWTATILLGDWLGESLRGLVPALVLATGFVIGGTTLSSAEATAAEPLLGKQLIARLKKVRPDIPILSVAESPVPGIYAIELEGGTMVYGTAAGTHLFVGDLYSIGDNDLINLAEVGRQQMRKDLLAAVPDKEAWVFSPVGTTKATISVFTDIDCGYCRKLHLEVPRLNELGIAVRYLAYPRAGIGSESYNTIVSAWCADDRGAALTRAKAGTKIAKKTCVNPVADQYELGQLLGVTGTPAIVTASGKLLPGYMPADILAATLGVPAT